LVPYSLNADNVSQSAVFSTQTFITAGLDYTPVKRVHIMPNIWYTGFKSMDTNLTSTQKLAKSDYDLVYRITFYYIFNASKSVNNNGMDN
jgi:hypothetical protein